MKVDQVRDSFNCRVDEVRYFVKIVDVVRVDQVRVDQVGCSRYINGVSLDIEDKLTYLGSILGVNGGKKHCENHCRAAHPSFYGLQGEELSLLV